MGQKLLSRVKEKSAWKANDLRNDSSWIYMLTPEEISEIRSAVSIVQQKKLSLQEIEKGNFEIPLFSRTLEKVWGQLENGTGCALVRGLPGKEFSTEQMGIIFCGVGKYLGQAITQNAQGDLLGHVRNEGLKYGEKDVRGYQTSAKLRFHCDNCDVVGLMCVRPAKNGGVSQVSSSMAIYNQILEERPDLLDTLYEGFHHDLRGEQQAGTLPVTQNKIPVFSYYDGELSCRYVGSTIYLAAKRTGYVFSEPEASALEIFERLAECGELRYDMDMRHGDMQFLNNHVTLHSRTAFEDHEDPKQGRHLLRLWLNCQTKRQLAPEFKDRFGAGSGMGIPAPQATTKI
ncbi:MAG: TauD/TfdA family dioxygenase [Betaproteobacteria bacterium]|nr:TauD/TfdA family dioxygenase [Betaproteobacteria bacterium]